MTTPYDQIAEESMLGAMLLTPAAAMVGVDACQGEDFYLPKHQRIFAAIASLVKDGVIPDAVTVAAEMDDNSVAPDLITLQSNTPSSVGIAGYARIVMEKSAARKIQRYMADMLTIINDGGDPYVEADAAGNFLAAIGSPHTGGPESMTFSELLEHAASRKDQAAVIPGLLNRDYRTILVAEEGAGKSLIMRAMAMMASQGVHPFSHEPMVPIRALVVDLENPEEAVIQNTDILYDTLAKRVPDFDDERWRVWRRPGGMDIRRLSDRAELQREIAFHRPDLVCLGPIYKMYRRQSNESYEDSADGAMQVLDELRTKFNFALIMEHHAAKGTKGDRDLSPFGSQRWMAWPEVGLSLYKDKNDPTILNVKRYRGDRLRGVDWPDRIVRNKVLLINGAWDGRSPRGQ